MSKKLLNEGTIKRFMKLANLAPINNEMISEMAMDYKRDDEPVEEGHDADHMEEAAHGDEEPMEEMAHGDKEPMEEEMELADEIEVAADAPAAAPEDLLRRVVQAVAAELEVDVEIEGDAVEAAADDEGNDVNVDVSDVEGDVELDVTDDNEGDVTDADEEEEDAEMQMMQEVEAMLAEAGIEVVDDENSEQLTEDIVKRVSARVAQRLLKEFS